MPNKSPLNVNNFYRNGDEDENCSDCQQPALYAKLVYMLTTVAFGGSVADVAPMASVACVKKVTEPGGELKDAHVMAGYSF